MHSEHQQTAGTAITSADVNALCLLLLSTLLLLLLLLLL
jgi:hypothetical protein